MMDLPTQNAQQRINPIEMNRRPTDRYFSLVFLPIFVTWIVTAILGLFSRQRTDDGVDQLQKKFLQEKFIMNAIFMRFSYELVISLISSSGIMLLFVILIGKFTKFFVCLPLILDTLYTLGDEFGLLYGTIKKYKSLLEVMIVYRVYLLYGNVLLMVVCLMSLYKVGINAPTNIIRTSCWMILDSPLLIFFNGLMVVLGYLVISFTINVEAAHSLSDRSESLVQCFRIINALGACLTLNFVLSFAVMVNSDYTINYSWKNGTKRQIRQSIIQVLRYHIGTIMFSSTIPISMLCALVQALRHKPSWKKEKRIIHTSSAFFLTASMPFVTATIFTSIYGTNFVKSSLTALDTVLRRCSLYLITTWMIVALYLFIHLIATKLADVMAFTFVGRSIDNDEEYLTYILVRYGFLYIPVSFNLLIYISARSLLFNQIIILNREDQLGGRLD